MRQRVAEVCTESVLGMLLSLLIATGSSAQEKKEQGSIDALTPSQQIGLDAFVAACFPGTKVNVVRATKEDFWLSARPPALNVQFELDGKRGSATIDRENGRVYRYFSSGQVQNDSADLISERVAWDICKRVLTYLGIKEERSSFDLQVVKEGNHRDVWYLSRDFAHEGVPCRGSRLRIQVGASSGILENFSYAPPIAPRQKPLKRLPKERAVEIAKEWLEKCSYFSGKNAQVTQDLTQVAEVIAPRNDLVPNLQPVQDEDCDKTYYCWEVPFAFVERDHAFSAWLWVNMDTGEVIGLRGK